MSTEFREELSKLDHEIRFVRSPEECQVYHFQDMLERTIWKKESFLSEKTQVNQGSVTETDIGLANITITGA